MRRSVVNAWHLNFAEGMTSDLKNMKMNHKKPAKLPRSTHAHASPRVHSFGCGCLCCLLLVPNMMCSKLHHDDDDDDDVVVVVTEQREDSKSYLG
jgi:hypothetical protein